MLIIITSAFVSFFVSLIMMKWHINNIEKLYEKYFDLEDSNIKRFSEAVIESIERH